MLGKLPVAGSRAAQSEAGRGLLQELLAARTGRPWPLSHDDDGRPRLGEDGPAVSLSHSGIWLAAAMARRGRIGIDIEAHRPGRDRGAIAERWFTPDEQAVIGPGGEPALLACWTLREAYGKAAGGGVATALAVDGRALLPAVGGSASATLDGRRWVFAQAGTADFQAALAWEEGEECQLTAALAEAITKFAASHK